MKGLLIKDYILSWKHFRFPFLLMLVLVIISAFRPDKDLFTFCSLYFMMICSIVSVNGRDENADTVSWTLCMPFSRMMLVIEKYIMILLNMTLSFLFCYLLYMVRGDNQIELLLTYGLACILSQCIFIPLSYTFGLMKAKVFYIVIIALYGGLAGGGFFEKITPIVLWILIAVTIIALLLSVVCSVWVYQRKQF